MNEKQTIEVKISFNRPDLNSCEKKRHQITSWLNDEGFDNVCDGFIAVAESEERACAEEEWSYAPLMIYVEAVDQAEKIKTYIDQTFANDLEVEIKPIDEKIWQTAWQEDFKTWESERLRVSPLSEQTQQIPSDRIDIVIEEQLAFGTGQHATTHALILQLEKNSEKLSGKTVFDFGCGTGILLIAAEKLAAEKVIGNDLDSSIVSVCQKNFTLNKTKNAEVFVGKNKNYYGKSDLVIVNILFPHILELLPKANLYAKNDAYLLTSGYHLNDRNEVVSLCNELNYSLVSQSDVRGWCADLFSKG